MTISELNERYEKTCEELDNLNARYRAYMSCYVSPKPEDNTEFYKILNKLELDRKIKQDEKDTLIKHIRSANQEKLTAELTGTKCKEPT